jgi:hypothetical protein
MNKSPFILEEVTDPVAIAQHRQRREQAQLNIDWLQAHWPDLLPQTLGKFLAVAGQEAFIANTPREAIALAQAAHPDDKGSLIQYVRPEKRPRIYGNRWRMDLRRGRQPASVPLESHV